MAVVPFITPQRPYMATRFYDMLRVAGYGKLGMYYWSYKFSKFFFHFIQPNTVVIPCPDYRKLELAIEGFMHSGNSFLRSNVCAEWQTAVVSHAHRLWSLRYDLSHNIPTALLIRDPQDVALSMVARSLRSRSGPTTGETAFDCWIRYYSYAWQRRSTLVIIPFDQLISEYAKVRARLERASKVSFRSVPRFDCVNQREELGGELEWNARAARLAGRAQQLYRQFITYAAMQENAAHDLMELGPSSFNPPCDSGGETDGGKVAPGEYSTPISDVLFKIE